ncbi:MAG TPA: tetratricopeptide repeat protein [Methylomirabilota bacterium]|nr:tetratricopeptide repeat protein [Methylomirabilota bacterium]
MTLAGVLGLVAALLLVAPAAAGADRARDLADLGDRTSAEARQRGARGLGRTGTMDDLPSLVRALRDTDAEVRASSEASMWEIWSRSGDAEIDRLFARGVEQMTAHEAEAAVQTFSRIIQRRPDFAEGWNKRATLYYLLGDYERSLADCDEVMRRNPYHFGALSGYGMIFMRLGQPETALGYFERALTINPNLSQVEEAVRLLREILIQKRKDTI